LRAQSRAQALLPGLRPVLLGILPALLVVLPGRLHQPQAAGTLLMQLDHPSPVLPAGQGQQQQALAGVPLPSLCMVVYARGCGSLLACRDWLLAAESGVSALPGGGVSSWDSR
jgi:hypothetical protein